MNIYQNKRDLDFYVCLFEELEIVVQLYNHRPPSVNNANPINSFKELVDNYYQPCPEEKRAFILELVKSHLLSQQEQLIKRAEELEGFIQEVEGELTELTQPQSTDQG